MEVILQMDIPKLGVAGDIVKVKNGYGRNYLLPKNLAMMANPKNIKQLEHQKRMIAAQEDKRKKSAEEVSAAMSGKSVTIARTAGEEDRIFGSVTARDISEALRKEGIIIDRRNIDLSSPIKEIGTFDVPIQLHREVTVTVKVWVVKE